MIKERFRASDYRFIAICLAMLAVTTWYSLGNFHRAFPEASIDFRVNRNGGASLADGFLASQDYRIHGYRMASRFSFDDDAKTFLEREAGLERANQIMSTRVHMWRWSYRWFRPSQKEEYRVDITPAGEFVGFAHELPEDAARPAVTPEQARAQAEEFLRDRVHRDPATLDFVEAAEFTRPTRVDRTFTWKERDFNLGGSEYRLEVTLLGAETGGYREYLKIPETWARDYQRLRSKNEVATYVDLALMMALILGLVATIVMRVRGQDIRWRRAAFVGAAAVALSLLASLNEFPLQEFGYPTTDSYGSFLSREVLQALLTALGYGGLLFVITAGAEPLYRAAFPGRISLGNLFRPRGLRTKRFFLGAILGISLTGAFIAYQTAFYIVAYRHGAWSPADVPYSDLLNTRFPWLFVLFGGFFPAVSEEFLFRMFAIPFLRKLARSVVVAVVLAAFIWGFGHAAYPQQPFYIRGVEVGIGGIVLGLIMLRWGILPTLVWHYSVDAMYSAMLLMRSHSLYFKLSGAAAAGIVALPVLAALAAYWIRGGFEPETGLLNGDESGPAPAPSAPPVAEGAAARYLPMSARRRMAAVAIAIVCLLALLVPVAHFGESPKFKLSAGEARAAAAGFLRAQGFNTGSFRFVTFPDDSWEGDESLRAKYFLERRSVSAASALFESYRPLRYWAVRYFKPLDQEEALVAVQPETFRVIGFHHAVPEDRPGADLSPEAARSIAEAFAAAHGWDAAAMDLKESGSEKRKARRDYTLVWEARPGDPRNVDEARYRLRIVVAGDVVTEARVFWKLPEAWTRARERQNAVSILVMGLRIAILSGGLVWAVWMLIGFIRQGVVRWRAALGLATAPALLAAAAALLALPLMLKSYPTSIPFESFQVVMYLTLAIQLVLAFLVMAGAAVFLTSAYPDSTEVLRRAGRRSMGLDAAAALAAAIGISLALGQVRALLHALFPAQALFSIGSPDLLATTAPAAAALAGAVGSTLTAAAGLAAIALAIRKAPARWLPVAAAFLLPFAMMPPDARTPGEFALAYGLALLAVASAAGFCFWFARGNYLAYALVLWFTALRTPLAQLFATANPTFQAQAWTVAAVLALVAVWAVYPAFLRGPGAARGVTPKP